MLLPARRAARHRWLLLPAGVSLVLLAAAGCSASASGDDCDDSDTPEATDTYDEQPQSESSVTSEQGTEPPVTDKTEPGLAVDAEGVLLDPHDPSLERLIVHLQGDWPATSEGGPAGGYRDFQDEINTVKDAVLTDLGKHGGLRNPEGRLAATGTPYLLVSVDPTGREILEDHPDVAQLEVPGTFELDDEGDDGVLDADG